MKRCWFLLPLVSFILSIIGIWHALPMHVVGDEEALIGGALKMIELKTLIPSLHPTDFASLYYPPLISYLILIVIIPIVLVKWVLLGFSVSGLQDYFALNQNGIWIAARLLSALFAAGTVAVVYYIAKRMFSEKIAWLSSVLLITSFFHIVVSHWVRHWTFTTFFVYATVLAWMWLVERKKGVTERHTVIANERERSVAISNNDHRQNEIASQSLAMTNSTRLFFSILPALLGGLGFGVSYLGGLGFFVGLAYAWFKRNEIVYFKKIIVSNIFVFGLLACIFALLNIQEVYRMISPVDGSLSDPKTFTGLIGTMRDIGLILIRHEIVLVVLASLGIVFGTRYRTMAGFIAGWLVVYAALIYGAFHLELRYVYLVIPAMCLLAGIALSSIHDFLLSLRGVPMQHRNDAAISNFVTNQGKIARLDRRQARQASLNARNDKRRRVLIKAIIVLVFLWPVASIVQYERLLLQDDTREQAVEWIQENIQPNEPFIISSETMIVPRTSDAIEQDQVMGRVRASERYKIKNQESRIKNYEKRFDYYNLHFWNEDLTNEEINEFTNQAQPKYFIVDYWSKEKLSDRERAFVERGTLVRQFRQSTLDEWYDVNGNFFTFNDILFKIDRLGPIVDVIKLREDGG